MTTQQLILSGVFVYFAIGAIIACGVTYVSMGFAGRLEPMAFALFFLWPFFYLLKMSPVMIFVLIGLVAASGMTALAYFLIHAFQ